MEINGFNIGIGVPGKAKISTINYLARLRAPWRKLREAPVMIKRFGVSLLTLSPFYDSHPAVAEIKYRNNREITLNYNKEIDFKIQRSDLAGRADFVLGVQDRSGCTKKLSDLHENDPVIVSCLPADVAGIEKETGWALPGRPIFDVTYKGHDIFRIESLDNHRILYVNMNLITQPEISELEFDDIIQKNAEKLEKILTLPELKRAECFLFMTVSTRGEILAGTEEKTEDEGYFEVILIISPDRPLELIPQNMLEMLGGTARVVKVSKEETGMPVIIKKILLSSLATYNMKNWQN